MSSFSRMATVSVITKRPPAVSGGKRGEPVIHLTDFRCTPFDPVGTSAIMASEIRQRKGLKAGVELLETYVDGGADIQEGDVLVVNNVEYPIHAVSDWTWRGADFKALIVEQIKR